MELQWFGNNCFLCKGDNVTVLIDPYTEALKKIPVEVDIVVRTNDTEDKFNIDGIEYKHLFDWPGEFEAGGVAVTMIPVDKFSSESMLAQILIDEFKIANLGYLNTDLEDTQTEALGDIDILMVPVGGNDVYDAKKASNAIEMIEPKMVIPTCYDGDYASLDTFAKEEGANFGDGEKKLKIKSPSTLSVDSTEYVKILMS